MNTKRFSVRRYINRKGNGIEHGLIADMAEKTGIHFNTATKYFNGIDLHAVHLDVLTKICAYLEREFGEDKELPGALFYDDTLWNTLKDLDVTFFVGANQFVGKVLDFESRISRNDHGAQSMLAAQLAGLNPDRNDLQEEFVVYNHEPRSRTDDDQSDQQESEDATENPSEDDRDDARSLYEKYFGSSRKLKGNIIIGSQKANLLTELFFAECFSTAPFESPDEPPRVPVFLIPREKDDLFTSCFGAKKPPDVIERRHAAGIHYRDDDGSWKNSIEWFDGTQDAGVILIRHQPVADVLDMAIFGFSGLGTKALARWLIDKGELFWDAEQRGKMHLGLYLCEITLSDSTVRKVIPIHCGKEPKNVLEAASAAG